jgi:hypothetical protein
MSFNPLKERGMPLEKQFRNWQELNTQPYNKFEVDPYTRCRVITMNGIEIESILHSHQFARHIADQDIRRTLAMIRRIEQQQQKAVNWLIPGEESTLEATIGYEQVAVDLTAYLARTEPDPYIRQNFEFGLLEDFDHLYRYANLLDLLEGKKAEDLVDHLTEVIPGRPTILEHRHPYDDVRQYSDCRKSDPISSLHVLTLVAAEQQTMNFYMTVGNRPMHPLARSLYLEIGQIEEQHVTQYESLLDPRMSWLEGEVLHQYNECYMYYSFMSQESDPRIQRLWELHLDMELEHLHQAVELLKRIENKDPEEFLPKTLPEPVKFESNKAYIREVLASQLELTGREEAIVPMGELSDQPNRFQWYQDIVNGLKDGTMVPSEEVIRMHTAQFGSDYRIQDEGPHPHEGGRQQQPQAFATGRPL